MYLFVSERGFIAIIIQLFQQDGKDYLDLLGQRL